MYLLMSHFRHAIVSSFVLNQPYTGCPTLLGTGTTCIGSWCLEQSQIKECLIILYVSLHHNKSWHLIHLQGLREVKEETREVGVPYSTGTGRPSQTIYRPGVRQRWINWIFPTTFRGKNYIGYRRRTRRESSWAKGVGITSFNEIPTAITSPQTKCRNIVTRLLQRKDHQWMLMFGEKKG